MLRKNELTYTICTIFEENSKFSKANLGWVIIISPKVIRDDTKYILNSLSIFG